MTLLATGAAALLATAPTSGSATPGATQLPRGLEPTDVTPGVAGFLATAFVVVLSIFLILDLVRRMRRIRHRGAREEARERAAAARTAEAPAGPLAAADPAVALGEGHPVVAGEVRDGGPAEAPDVDSGAGPRRSRATPDEPEAPAAGRHLE